MTLGTWISIFHTTVQLGELPGWEEMPSYTDLLGDLGQLTSPCLGLSLLICDCLAWPGPGADEALFPGSGDTILQEL